MDVNETEDVFALKSKRKKEELFYRLIKKQKEMALSKRIRFEVFKRDGFKCQYCGNHPPVVILEVDHIQPKSKEGLDDINNLITSCFDCNRGKSNIELTQIPKTLIENRELIEEKELQYLEYSKILKRIKNRIAKEVSELKDIFNNYYPEMWFSKSFINSVTTFVENLGCDEAEKALHKSCSKITNDPRRALAYFCGICWRKIKGESAY